MSKSTASITQIGTSDSQSLAQMLLLHRDWRIDAVEPDKSVVFMSAARAGAQLSPVSGDSRSGRDLLPVFYALAQAIEVHRRKLMVQAGKTDGSAEPRTFAIVVQGVRCRVQLVQDTRYHVRVPSELMGFSQLGMPDGLKRKLTSSDLDGGGLVVVCGGYGSGKTTTVNAIVRQRIEARGGYALVLGHPIEYEYAGFHGSNAQPGYIEQVDLVGLDMGAEVRASMRNFPAGAVSILAYPELIGSEGVGEMLRAANRGNLVFADMHALNVEASILNLVSMGEQDGEGYARDLLANSLRLIIHQKMVSMPNATQGMMVSYTSIMVNRSMRAAIVDRSVTLSRAITSVLSDSQLQNA